MIRRPLFLLILLSIIFVNSSYAGNCTISVNPITYTIPAAETANGGIKLQDGTMTINITCPSAQTWTLISANPAANAYTYFQNGSSHQVIMYYCKTQTDCDTKTQDIYNANTITTGTGTGSAQTVTLYTSAYGSGATCSCTPSCGSGYFSCDSSSAYTPYEFYSNVFKLTADTTYYASVSGSITLAQTCMVNAVSNITQAYNGTADVTNSLTVQYVCGASGTAVTLNLGAGNNASGQVRRATYSGGYITYRLYEDSGYTEEIGVTTGNNFTIVNYGTQTVYFKTKVADNSVVGKQGAYTDTVVVTLTF